MNERKGIKILNEKVSLRSLVDEKLKLNHFGCSVPNCDWKFDQKNLTESDFHTAIEAHGQHNLQNHIDDLQSQVVYVYGRILNGK